MTIIALPLKRRPTFPNLCVGCGKAGPRYCDCPLADGRDPPVIQPGLEAFAWLQELEVPYCGRCHPSRRLARVPIVRLLAVGLAACLLPAWAAQGAFDLSEGTTRGLFCLTVAALLGGAWWWATSACAVRVRLVGDDVLEFRFRNARVAGAFARLNAAADTFDPERR